MSDNLRRYGDLLRLYERGHVLDTVHPSMFADEAMPWATVVREVGFTNIDARADFERAIHTFDEPSPRARDVRSARAAIVKETQATFRRMSNEEQLVAMCHWMYVHQIKTETKRIAATVAELGRELGQDEPTVARWISGAMTAGIVTHYREPKPGNPADHYCLTADALTLADDPVALAGHLARLVAKNAIPTGRGQPVFRKVAMLPPDDCHLIAECLRVEISSLQALGGWLADHSVALPSHGEVARRIEAMEGLSMRLMGAVDPMIPPPVSEEEWPLIVLAVDAAIAHGRDQLATLQTVARHPDITRPAEEPLRKLEAIRAWPILASTPPVSRIGLRDLLTDDGIAQLQAERRELLSSFARAGIDVGVLPDDDSGHGGSGSGAVTSAQLQPARDQRTGEVKPMAPDRRTVFVVHGRNAAAKAAIFDFLRAIDLKPLEWSQAVKLTGKASPYVLDVVEAGLAAAQAVVVILTGDDVAMLHPRFRGAHETERGPHLQPRPNVLLEAGMAIVGGRERTVVVEFGDLRGASDLVGIHTLRVFPGDSTAFRNDLAGRLQTAKCDVNRDGNDWLKNGDFDAAFLDLPVAEALPEGANSTGAISKLQGLRTVVGRQLENERNLYFDPARMLDLFTRYGSVRDQIRGLAVFDDLPVRTVPQPSKTTDFDGRGYIERRHVEDLAHDIEYCLTVLERSDAGVR